MRRKSALELRRKKTTCCNFGGSNEKPETCPLEFHHRGAVSLCCALKSIALYAQSNPPSILTDSRQLIVLVTPHWNAVNGTLRRYQRENAADVWQPIGGSFPVVIGAREWHGAPGFSAVKIRNSKWKEINARPRESMRSVLLLVLSLILDRI